MCIVCAPTRSMARNRLIRSIKSKAAWHVTDTSQAAAAVAVAPHVRYARGQCCDRRVPRGGRSWGKCVRVGSGFSTGAGDALMGVYAVKLCTTTGCRSLAIPSHDASTPCMGNAALVSGVAPMKLQ